MRYFSKIKKSLLGIFIALFVASQLLGLFAFVSPVKAQFGSPDVVAFDTVKWAWEKIMDALKGAAMSALSQASSYFMKKLSFQTAKYMAAGGVGQGAMAFIQSPGDYFKSVAGDSAATAIGALGNSFGLNLSQPGGAQLSSFLQVSLSKMNSGGVLSNISGGDFGIALGAMSKIDQAKESAITAAQAERTDMGYKAQRKPISGEITTPAQSVKKESEATSASESSKQSSSQVSGIYGSNSLQMLPMAASTFLSSITSQLLNKLMSWTDGLLGGGGGGGQSGDSGVASFYSQNIQNRRQQAEETFGFLVASVSQKQLETYEVITEFAICPDNPGLNNCVIDTGESSLQNALQRAPITVGEALKQGLLHPDWPLISPRRVTDNTDIRNCVTHAYCYSNLQKLRKARVLPLGFEIAALKASPDNLTDWELGKVVAGFDVCHYVDTNGDGKMDKAILDSKYPYCHLIDPNWIIKSPEAHCEAIVKDPILADKNVADRREECADISTRIIEGDSVKNPGYFSYCLKEKNIWNLGGKSCEPQYGTCQTFIDRAGSAASYLARTLDYGECNSDTAGCRAYALEKEGERWKNNTEIALPLKELGRPQTLFFNDKIKTYSCPDSADGCSAFSAALPDGQKGALLYFKKAPDYLGCYDIKNNTAEIDWPKTKVDLLALAERPTECGKFAAVCLSSEAGCEKYQPAEGGPDIPGIIGANSCPAECVGYDTFKQEATNFYSSTFPLYFIPASGQSCQPQYKGCDEFTNIDAKARGGEGLEYYTDLRYCERPDGQNQRTFYSWEGSANEGYVLKVHKVLQINEQEAAYISGIFSSIDPTEAQIKSVLGKGSPAYVDDSKKALADNYDLCNETKYNTLINNPYSPDAADPDCRALYDDQGKIYYRLLAETVTVDDSCHPLRKTETNLQIDPNLSATATDPDGKNLCVAKGGRVVDGKCERCYHGGKLDDKKSACIYWTISKPSESVSCPAEASGCRAYTGNTGNNVEKVLINNEEVASFEPMDNSEDALNSAKEGWTGVGVEVKVKPEAIQVGQYSLGVKGIGEARYTFASNTLAKDEWYELSFWARGDAQNLSVINFAQNNQGVGEFTKNILTGEGLSVPIGGAWQEYRLGPVQFTGLGAEPADIVFTNININNNTNTNIQYFLDNVRLVRLQDHDYRIKDSWKTREGYDAPLSCDSDPTDAFPGEALGCRAYTDSRGTEVYATGFEQMCRPEAVGCKAVYDTFNTLEETGATAYNVWCEDAKAKNGKCALTYVEGEETKELGSCITGGQTGCYIDKVVLPEGITALNKIEKTKMMPSTVFIPADTPTSTPIYLTDRQEFNPNNICINYLGCQKMALENYALAGGTASTSYEFSDPYFLNNSEHYKDTLCKQELLGCEQYKSGSNVVFFKNPQITGNALCSYRPLVETTPGNKVSGWFREAVGKCAFGNDLCRSDADCLPTGKAGEEKNKCDMNKPVPCYPDYLSAGEYGLWSNKSEKYKGFVGLCPAEKDGCVELVDPADKDTSQKQVVGKPYYVIFNQDLQNKAGECQGKASLKEGCVLFDKTDQPTKLYDTSATYASSELAKPKYSSVSLVTKGNLDANILLKVERDRQCSEWLACKSSMTVWGDDNKPQEVCHGLGICRELGPANNQCVEWIKASLNANAASPFPLLNEAYYIGRNVSWYGEEYSGYSLFNHFDIKNLATFFFTGEDRLYLGSVDKGANVDCKGANDDGVPCGSDKKEGRCYDKKCVYPLDGVFAGIATPDTPMAVEDIKSNLEAAQCKNYPEKDSPFPDYLVLVIEHKEQKIDPLGDPNGVFRYEFTENKENYPNANVCQKGDCSCEYQRVEYKNGVKYFWPLDMASKIPDGICADIGSKSGWPCVENKECGDDGQGQCIMKKSQSRRLGQRGFCLEPDLSRPLGIGQDGKTIFACLTWLPLDTAASFIDSYNYNERAGYTPELDAKGSPGEVYCTEAIGRGYTVSGTMFSAEIHNKLTIAAFVKGNPFDYNNPFSLSLPNVYTALQMYGWYKDLTAKSGKTNLNTMVWYVNKLFGPESARGWNYYLKNKTPNYDDYFNWKSVVASSYFDAIGSTGALLYAGDIKRIYFAPFVYYRYGDGNNLYLVNSIFIDFPELETVKPKTFGNTKVQIRQYIVNYVGDMQFAYYTFKGTVDYSQSTRIGDAANSNENGRVRYGLLVDISGAIPETAISQQIAWIMDHSTNVQWASGVGRNIRLEYIMDFDANTHQMLDGGYWWAPQPIGDYSVAVNQLTSFPSLGALIEFLPRCVEYTNVYNSAYKPSTIFNGTNKAWTDRVWQYSRFNYFDVKNIEIENGGKEGKFYRKDKSTAPYGPTTLRQSDLSNDDKLRKYYFNDSQIDGYPYSCLADIFIGKDFGSLSQIPVLIDYAPPPKEKFICPVLAQSSDANYQEIAKNLPLYGSFHGEGTYLLKNFFVKAYQVKVRTDNEKFNKAPIDTDWDTSALSPFSPVIYSLNPFTCFEDKKQMCSVWQENGFTVNRRNGLYKNADYNGDKVPDEDFNHDGKADPMIYYGSANVTVDFFAVADDDHMPIRRVMVDWGDGEVLNEKQFGFYKNRKPVCELIDSASASTVGRCAKTAITCQTDSDCKGMLIECDTNAKRAAANQALLPRFFGDSARACSSHYFEFVHNYTCSAETDAQFKKTVGSLLDEEKEALNAKGYSDTDKVCVFKPGAQVLDNWGWCTGSYYIDSKVPSNGCALDNIKAWTRFEGKIIVTPEK